MIRFIIILFASCLSACSAGLGFFNPYSRADAGLLLEDTFDRGSLGTTWTVESSANITVAGNQLKVIGTGSSTTVAWYKQPSSCENYTLSWNQQSSNLDAGSFGSFVGLRNVQAVAAGNGVSLAAQLVTQTGANVGKCAIYRWDGTTFTLLSSSTTGLVLNATDIIQGRLTQDRQNSVTASYSNTVNGSICSCVSTSANGTISAYGVWASAGLNTQYVDNLRVRINVRVPVRFLVAGASIAWGARGFATNRWVDVMNTNLMNPRRTFDPPPVLSDSSGYNNDTNFQNLVPEYKLYHPVNVAMADTLINSALFGVPQARTVLNSTITSIQSNGSKVMVLAGTPISVDLSTNHVYTMTSNMFPTGVTVVDTWFRMTNSVDGFSLALSLDGGDGLHPNAAGHRAIFTNTQPTFVKR